ncbi:MAG: hypothetical protein JO041_08080, partial [Acidobacteria bacterium]|nr:hypothetical protein [Acidobacteriota bacterium]
FAYYGLHPAQYAAMAGELLVRRPHIRRVAVAGIRSIGVALSAVVLQALAQEGIAGQRITVRPGGHPTNRSLALDSQQRAWVVEQAAAGSEFLVVDEGPGRSGSSFLATAEAVIEAGAARERITLFCSYQPDIDSLAADDAPARWRRLHALWPARGSRPLPRDAGEEISAGEWRRTLLDGHSPWPASWTATERLKFFSASADSILKFEGHGRYGRRVLERSITLAEGGFGPQCEADAAGFVRYARLPGQPAAPKDLSSAAIDRLAQYCAFRVQSFAAQHAGWHELRAMAEFNLANICGAGRMPELALPVLQPVITDGRMAPHEWIVTPVGRLMKTDAASHGDDHFYPGPADIAWDLAGAIIEWEMPPQGEREFLGRYSALAHDNPNPRIAGYKAAYLAFRIGFLEMAAQSSGEPERRRLMSESRRRQQQARLLRNLQPAITRRAVRNSLAI